MGKSLYRSYRSQSFDEIVGQEHIVTTLKNALKSDSVSHAYLLSGPRGVGKTSVARILAYAVNNQDYDLEATNLDIIEIDAASNRRIDEIREIRDKVNIAPSVGKYKVYIIDEVHMLTREAFNALLKTLEEPPAHVIFILATTETQKVPETIVSRCIRLNFRPIETPVLAEHLSMIAKKEKIKISNEALLLLAEHGRGSFRDSISLLEQIKYSSDNIQADDVSKMLGLAPKELINNILSALENGDTSQLSTLIGQAFEKGSDVYQLSSQLQDQLRDILLGNLVVDLSPAEILSIQRELLYVPGSPKPKLELELVLMKYSLQRQKGPQPKQKITEQSEEQKPEIKKPTRTTSNKPPAVAVSVGTPELSETIKQEVGETLEDSNNESEIWNNFLQELKKSNNTLYGIARMAEVEISGDKVTLTFQFAFHLKQVNESRNKTIFSEILERVSGKPMEITAQLKPSKSPDVAKKQDVGLQNVSNIFGGHEVLES